MPKDDEGAARPGLVDRAKAKAAAVRARRPMVDHGFRMVKHYGEVQGSLLAGAVTYFGYLSFFPVLALAFGVVGYVAIVYPAARDQLILALQSLFPGLVGPGDSAPISLDTFTESAGTASLVGAVGLLYSGLGWISALRTSLQDVFRVPTYEQPNFVRGKLVDVAALSAIGVVLLVSVSVSGAVTTLTERFVPGVAVLLTALGVLLGIVASTVLFFAIFSILLVHDVPRRALVKGALLAAIAFEALKLLAAVLIGQATENPATAILGTSLVLLVWINYFSRVTVFGAAWAYTSQEARDALTEPDLVSYQLLPEDHRAVAGSSSGTPSVLGGVTALGLALARRRRRQR